MSFRSALLLIAALPTGIAAIMTFRYRDRPGGAPLTLLMLAVAQWSLAGGLEAAARSVEAKVLWSQVSYVGVASSPVLLFLFAYEFSHRSTFPSRWQPFLWIVPVSAVIIAATNRHHQLLWTSFTPVNVSSDRLLIYGHGPFFWFFYGWTGVVLTSAAICIIHAALRSRGLYRRQALVLLLSLPVTVLPNVAYVLGIDPVPGRDWTPAAFSIVGLLAVWGFVRYSLLDVIPVAREWVVDELGDAVIVVDSEARIVDLNPAACELLSVPRGQGARQALADLAPWLRLEGSGEAGPLDGRYVEFDSSVLHGRHGAVRGRVVVVRDATQRIAARRELQRLNARLEAQVAACTAELTATCERDEAILWCVGEGVLVTDSVWRVTYSNPSFTKLTGYRAVDLLGRDAVALLIGPERHAGWELSITSPNAEGHWRGEMAIQTADGRALDTEMTVTPVRAPEGRLQGYVWTVQDITQRGQLARAGSRFLHDVANEFCTPVASLRRHADMMGGLDLPPNAGAYLDTIEGQIDWLMHLVSDVREMATLDSGGDGLCFETVLLLSLAESTRAHFEQQADEAGLTLVVVAGEPSDEAPSVWADRDWLTLALSELVHNALTFTPAGGRGTGDPHHVTGGRRGGRRPGRFSGP